MSVSTGQLDFSALTFTAEQVRDINALIKDKVLAAGMLNEFGTVFPNIVSSRKIGTIGELGFVGTADKGCDPTPDNDKGTAAQKEINPLIWDIFIQHCYTDYKDNLGVYALRAGKDISDLDGTDIAVVFADMLIVAIQKMLFRKAWFDEKDASRMNTGGHFNAGADLNKWNLIDGLWKQFLALGIEYSDQAYTIAKNAGNSYANQKLVAGEGIAILDALWSNAPAVLMEQSDIVGVITDSIYRRYVLDVKGTNQYTESAFGVLTDGIQTVKHLGITYLVMPYMDSIIKAVQDDGTKQYKPHRGLLTTKSNLMLAIDTTSETDYRSLRISYNDESRKLTTQAQGRLDALVIQDNLFSLAI